jgi:hypothetical protein
MMMMRRSVHKKKKSIRKTGEVRDYLRSFHILVDSMLAESIRSRCRWLKGNSVIGGAQN